MSAIFDNTYLGKKIKFRAVGNKEKEGDIIGLGMDANGRFVFLVVEDKVKFDSIPIHDCTLVNT
jgi:hypothetical protein